MPDPSRIEVIARFYIAEGSIMAYEADPGKVIHIVFQDKVGTFTEQLSIEWPIGQELDIITALKRGWKNYRTALEAICEMVHEKKRW